MDRPKQMAPSFRCHLDLSSSGWLWSRIKIEVCSFVSIYRVVWGVPPKKKGMGWWECMVEFVRWLWEWYILLKSGKILRKPMLGTWSDVMGYGIWLGAFPFCSSWCMHELLMSFSCMSCEIGFLVKRDRHGLPSHFLVHMAEVDLVLSELV